MNGVDVCSWSGVTCASSAVSQLQLMTNNLVGTLPTEFGLLTKLTKNLDLRANSLAKTLPTEIGALTALTQNVRFCCGLSGLVPTVSREGRTPRND